MDKNLKRCYENLDLEANASKEDVEIREKALIKLYNSKAIEKGVSYDKQIGIIESSAASIIENIKNNGASTENVHYYNSSWQSIGWLLIVLAIAAMCCVFSFWLFF